MIIAAAPHLQAFRGTGAVLELGILPYIQRAWTAIVPPALFRQRLGPDCPVPGIAAMRRSDRFFKAV